MVSSPTDSLIQPFENGASQFVSYLEHLLYVDRPVVPSARARAATANAEAVRLVCASIQRDQAIRLDAPNGTWLASTELDAGAVTALVRSTARAHGLAPRHMLTLRELSEEVIADALRSPRIDADERDRIITWARSLERRTTADLRRRETDDPPRSTQLTPVLAILFVVISLSVIVPGSLGALSAGITSTGGLATLGASSLATLGALLRQVLIARWSDRSAR